MNQISKNFETGEYELRLDVVNKPDYKKIAFTTYHFKKFDDLRAFLDKKGLSFEFSDWFK